MTKPPPVKNAGHDSLFFGTLLPATLVFCATVVAYLPALSAGFIWNDSDYVTAPALRSLSGLVRIWSEPGAVEQYYPLLHSAFWVQHRLWGDNPFGYHAVNVLLHAGCSLLFGLIVRRLLERKLAPETAPGPVAAAYLKEPYSGAGWLAALLFALHPVHVESVAWITEQKNTLSLAFYLAAALVYLRFDETRRPRNYVAALVLFLASVACKTSTVTLPAALLVIFWWKRGRLEWRRDWRPLFPWLALGIVAGLFSSWVEHNYVGARGGNFVASAPERLLVAGRSIWFYAGHLLWPFDLNFIYPRWTVDATVWWQWLFPCGVLALGAALWTLRRRTRAPLAAFLFFVGSLFPVLGFVNLYGARYSWVWDHWQYLPDLGLLALAAAGLTAGAHTVATHLRWLGRGLAATLAVLLGVLTWSHCQIFHDDEKLYATTLARNPGCWMAHNNLGMIWSQRPGRMNDAIAAFETALRLNPDFAEAHNSLGNAFAQTPGRLNDAITHFKEALRLNPDFADAHYNLGTAWSQMPGRRAEVIAEFEATLRLNPGHAEAHNNLGNALADTPGRLNDAIIQYKAALHLQPDYAPGWYNLGVCWYELGNLPAAAEAFREVLRLSPDHPNAQQALAAVLRKTGNR